MTGRNDPKAPNPSPSSDALAEEVQRLSEPRTKPRQILAPIPYYPPAVRAGGPTRSVPAIAAKFGTSLEFRVITRDRDLGGSERLEVVPDKWIRFRGVRTIYLSRSSILRGSVIRTARRTGHDVLYLNSLFSIAFTWVPLLCRRANLLPRRRTVLAPRGELDSGALGLKPWRKRLYLGLSRRLGLLDDLVWHAQSAAEVQTIRQHVGSAARVVLAPAIPAHIEPMAPGAPKVVGELSLVSIGRIARKKNLHFAIQALAGIDGAVNLDLYGPVEDRSYWRRCQSVIAALPPNVKVNHRGVIEPEVVQDVLARYHVFVAPTLGENFGHAIVEALLSGCPVLISDRTPWRGLAAENAGWDLPLSSLERFRQVLQHCVDLDEATFAEKRIAARRRGSRIRDDPSIELAYFELFQGPPA